MKKITSVFLAILMLISVIAIVPCAVNADDGSDGPALSILLCAPKHLVFGISGCDGDITEASATVNGKDYVCTPYDFELEDEDAEDADEEADEEEPGTLEDEETLDDDSPDDYDGRSFFDEFEGDLYETYYTAKLGDTVKVSVKTADGAVLTKSQKIVLGDGNIYVNVCDVNHVRFAFTSDTSLVEKAYVRVNGKTIAATVYDDEYNDSDDEDEDFDDSDDDEDDFFNEDEDWSFNVYKVCQAKYYAKKGNTVAITVVTDDGYTYTKSVKAGQAVPMLKVKDVYVGDTKLTGTTVANSSVAVTIGKKNFKFKSDKKGKFSQKISVCKKKTKIKVTVTTAQKCKAIKTVKVKMLYGKVKTKKFVNKSTKRVKVKITNARKGDIVKLKIGKDVYTKTVTSAKKTQNISFKINQVSKTTGVKVEYLNQFKNKKGSF